MESADWPRAVMQFLDNLTTIHANYCYFKINNVVAFPSVSDKWIFNFDIFTLSVFNARSD